MDRRNKPSALSATPAMPPQPRVDLVGDRVTAVLPGSGESVEVLLTGATVLAWKDGAGNDRLWLSEGAVLDGSKAVRGGIPVVFPVFGKADPGTPAGQLPQHGLARTSRWEFLGKSVSEASAEETITTSSGAGGSSSSSSKKASSSGVQLDFGLSAASADPKLRALWPHDFALLYRVTLEPGTLTTSIVVTNEGDKPFDFQVLLHTYLRVDNIADVAVTGLGGAPYVDKVGGRSEKTQAAGSDVTITGQTDRVYSPQGGASAPVTVAEKGKTRYTIARDNLDDVVVWNPWAEGAQSIGDFAPKDGFRTMLCVEPGAVAGWQTLEPGEAVEGAQSITAL